MKRLALVLVVLSAGLSCGCASVQKAIESLPTPKPPASCPDGLPIGSDGTCSTPKPPQPPSTPPTPDPHVPVCAGGNVSECWHQPPEGWRYNCSGGAPTVTDPSECRAPSPPAPGSPGCAPLSGGTCVEREHLPADQAIFAARAVDMAIDAACAAEGVTCGPEGPPRPGAWDTFVWRVAGSLTANGFCATYDYEHGEAGGRASELMVRPSGSTRGESFQIETSAGKVRRPPGAFRSVCTNVDSQPIRPPAGSPAPPTPTPKPPSPVAPPALSKLLCSSVGAGRIVIDCTPKTCEDPAWCAAHSTGGSCCPGGGEHDPEARQAVEAAWGPYAWTINGADCLASGECWPDGGNPLRVVAPSAAGKAIRCTGGNGVFGEVIP